ncbi:hypothetical protein BV882_01695 [Streptomyces sp. 46]|nr:hypothetical protein BV882_01695 [Streptomyces sp. 46]
MHLGDSAYARRAARDAGDPLPRDPATAGSGSPPHPPGPAVVLDEAEVQAFLVAALTQGRIDSGAEQRAVAAFRAARGSGAHRARSRRRDDWRPRERRLTGRSLRTTLSVLLASLTLGGVAVAAIGSSDSPSGSDEPGRSHAPTSPPAPGNPAGGPTGAESVSSAAPPGRPAAAQDTEAHCRAYEKAGRRGRVMDATAWQRLVAAAGGERHVTAYCAEQAARSDARPGRTAGPEKGTGASGNSGKGNGSGPGSANSGSKADSGSGKADSGSAGAVSGSGAGGGNSAAADDGSAAGSDGSGAERGSGGGQTRTGGRPARPDGSRP